jgi:hypothetical protein
MIYRTSCSYLICMALFATIHTAAHAVPISSPPSPSETKISSKELLIREPIKELRKHSTRLQKNKKIKAADHYALLNE